MPSYVELVSATGGAGANAHVHVLHAPRGIEGWCKGGGWFWIYAKKKKITRWKGPFNSREEVPRNSAEPRTHRQAFDMVDAVKLRPDEPESSEEKARKLATEAERLAGLGPV